MPKVCFQEGNLKLSWVLCYLLSEVIEILRYMFQNFKSKVDFSKVWLRDVEDDTKICSEKDFDKYLYCRITKLLCPIPCPSNFSFVVFFTSSKIYRSTLWYYSIQKSWWSDLSFPNASSQIYLRYILDDSPSRIVRNGPSELGNSGERRDDSPDHRNERNDNEIRIEDIIECSGDVDVRLCERQTSIPPEEIQMRKFSVSSF